MRGLKLDPLAREDTEKLIFEALRQDLIEAFHRDGELDTSYELEDSARFRVNVFEQTDGVGAVLRVITTDIPSPEDIGLDDVDPRADRPAARHRPGHRADGQR